MLQQIRDGLGRWVFGLIIGLIAISFVFWGIDFNIGTPTFAAKVNGEKIPLVDFQRDYQQQQNLYQQQTRSELTDPIREELRRSVVERLVSIEALHQRAEESGFRVSDERLTEFLQSIPQFQIEGEFSMDAYRAYPRQSGFGALTVRGTAAPAARDRGSSRWTSRIGLLYARRVPPLHRARQPAASGGLRAVRGQQFS